jgi:MFS superfamily sulfate permease-like transporter
VSDTESSCRLGLVAFSISISVAKILANKNNYEVDANQGLKALGLTNVVSSFFGCHVSSSSLSRSLLQETSGRTQLTAIFSSSVILVVLLALGPLFRTLPRCVLAAIIMVALRKMFLQVSDLPRLWKISKWDFAIWVATFLSTVLLDVPHGLFVGIVFSIFQIIYRVQTPYVCSLGRVGATNVFKDTRIHAEAKEIKASATVRQTMLRNNIY